jgi:hypothetical protein
MEKSLIDIFDITITLNYFFLPSPRVFPLPWIMKCVVRFYAMATKGVLAGPYFSKLNIA